MRRHRCPGRAAPRRSGYPKSPDRLCTGRFRGRAHAPRPPSTGRHRPYRSPGPAAAAIPGPAPYCAGPHATRRDPSCTHPADPSGRGRRQCTAVPESGPAHARWCDRIRPAPCRSAEPVASHGVAGHECRDVLGGARSEPIPRLEHPASHPRSHAPAQPNQLPLQHDPALHRARSTHDARSDGIPEPAAPRRSRHCGTDSPRPAHPPENPCRTTLYRHVDRESR